MVYLNGRYVPMEEAVVPIEDRGYQFADGVYEVVFVWGGRYAFMDRHMRRLERSLSELSIPLPQGVRSMEDVSGELLRQEPRDVAALYIQITRGVAPRDHKFPSPVPPTVVAYLKAAAAPGPEMDEGADVILLPDERWLRCDVKSVSLLPNILARQKAVASGAREAVLARDGLITECAASNFFAVRDGVLRTHALSPLILGGITREVVLEEADRLRIPVSLEPLRVEEAFTADELFLTSTTSHVLPIRTLDGRPVSSPKGQITSALQEAYFARLGKESGKPVGAQRR